MTFDFKKEFKEFYLPPKKPAVVRIPSMKIRCGARSRQPERRERRI